MLNMAPFSTAEAAVITAIVRSRRTCARVGRDDLAAGALVAAGWLDFWDEGHDDHVKVTFTPMGAEALGLKLAGQPARWRPLAARERPDRASAMGGGRVVPAGVLGGDVNLDTFAGPIQHPPDLDAPIGFIVHNGMKHYRAPRVIVGIGTPWGEARTGDEHGAPCLVCDTGAILRPGHFCACCCRYYLPGAIGPDNGAAPRMNYRPRKPRPPAKVKAPRRDRRQVARAA